MCSSQKTLTNKIVLAELETWLSEIDENLKLPSNMDHEFMEYVFQIMNCDKKGRRDASETKKLQLKFIADYKNSTEEINTVLSTAGLTLDTYPPPFQEKVQTIAKLAVALNLNNPRLTSLILGLSNLQAAKEKQLEQKKIQVHTMSKLARRVNFVTEQNQEFKKFLAQEEKLVKALESQQPKIESGTKFLQNKCDEYTTKQKKLQEILKKSGFDPLLCHTELTKQSQELGMLNEKLNSLTLKLESYQNLPPDEYLTKLKLKEARAELARLEKEFESKSAFGFEN